MDNVALRYKGPGIFPGVPQRDLSQEEADYYGPDAVKAMLESGWWEKARLGGAEDKALRPAAANKGGEA